MCWGRLGGLAPRRAEVVSPLVPPSVLGLAQGRVGGGRMRGLDREATWSRGPHPALGVLSQRWSSGGEGLLPVSGKGLEALWAPGLTLASGGHAGSMGASICLPLGAVGVGGCWTVALGPPWRVPCATSAPMSVRNHCCASFQPLNLSWWPWGLLGVELWAGCGQTLGCVCSGCLGSMRAADSQCWMWFFNSNNQPLRRRGVPVCVRVCLCVCTCAGGEPGV